MPPSVDENFLDELDTLTPQSGGGQTRLRVDPKLISFRYRLKQFWANAGVELLLILLLFFSLRQILATGATSEESRHLAAQSLEWSRGDLDLSLLPSAPSSPRAHELWQASQADGAIIPLGLITLVTGGGEGVLNFVTLVLAITSILGIYACGKELFAPENGIGAALLLVMIPGFLTYASGLFALSFAFAYSSLSLWLLIRSRRSSGKPGLILAGVFLSLALHSEPLFIYLVVFFALFWSESGAKSKQILPVILGFLASELLLGLVSFLTMKLGPFSYLTSLFATNPQLDSSGYTGLADLFGQLLSSPLVLPFTLLAIFGIGYTLRTSRSSFPWQPLLLLVAAYFTLEFMPKSFSPWTTLAKTDRMLAVMSSPLALVSGTMLAGLGNKQVLRWMALGAGLLALPLLLVY